MRFISSNFECVQLKHLFAAMSLKLYPGSTRQIHRNRKKTVIFEIWGKEGPNYFFYHILRKAHCHAVMGVIAVI
uniref:Uncharacterized protein n=1 Tax=Arundo donax TaxID=35708 RepID=A0A0A9G1C5_ARUDO